MATRINGARSDTEKLVGWNKSRRRLQSLFQKLRLELSREMESEEQLLALALAQLQHCQSTSMSMSGVRSIAKSIRAHSCDYAVLTLQEKHDRARTTIMPTIIVPRQQENHANPLPLLASVAAAVPSLTQQQDSCSAALGAKIDCRPKVSLPINHNA